MKIHPIKRVKLAFSSASPVKQAFILLVRAPTASSPMAILPFLKRPPWKVRVDDYSHLGSLSEPMSPPLRPPKSPKMSRIPGSNRGLNPVSYTHLRAHETDSYLVC